MIIGCDSADAAFCKGRAGGREAGETSKQSLRDDWLEDTGLPLSFVRHRHRQMVSDDLESDLIDGFGNGGIDIRQPHPRPGGA